MAALAGVGRPLERTIRRRDVCRVCPPLGWDLLGLHCLAAGDGIRTGTTSRSTAQDEHQRTAGTKKEDLHQGWPKARFTAQFRHQIR